MTTSSSVTRQLIAALAVACTGLLAAACGSSGSSGATPTVTKTVKVTAPDQPTGAGSGSAAPPSSASPSTPASPSAPTGCATSALHLAVGQGNGAAGSIYYPITFTNASSAPCSLYGFPGVSFVTEQGGSQIGRAATRNSDAPKTVITLDPGAVAHATLQVAEAANFPPGKCHMTTAHWLKVYPPNQTAPVFLPFKSQTCTSTAPDVTVLNVAPVTPGAADS